MRLAVATMILLAACAPRVSADGFAPANPRGAACFVMRERPDTLLTSAFQGHPWRVLLEQYAQRNARKGQIWFYTDSAVARRMSWGGWLRRGADTVEVHTGTYPTAHYRLQPDPRGNLSGRGVMTSDASVNGRTPTHTWAVELEPLACAALSR